ncbi:hypothetical protein Tco_1436945 [Tanacetum coccineum]
MYASRANYEDYLQRAQTEYQVEYAISFTLLHCCEVLKNDKLTRQEVPKFIAQREEHKSKSYKSSDDSSFNTRESGERNFNLNSMTGDEEDEV